MTKILLVPFRELFQFIAWWALVMPKRIYGWIVATILALDEILVLGTTIRLFFGVEPLFGDYGWRGRIIGFLFRFLRIIVSVVIYLGVFALGLVMLALWYLWPVIGIFLAFRV